MLLNSVIPLFFIYNVLMKRKLMMVIVGCTAVWCIFDAPSLSPIILSQRKHGDIRVYVYYYKPPCTLKRTRHLFRQRSMGLWLWTRWERWILWSSLVWLRIASRRTNLCTSNILWSAYAWAPEQQQYICSWTIKRHIFRWVCRVVWMRRLLCVPYAKATRLLE